MGQFYETIPESLMQWVLEQKMFCVATAPLAGSGHVNVSPKGGPYFGLLDNKTFWYLDLTGSGSETVAHLYEPANGRVTVMFNAFDGPPRIVRLFGHGRVLESATTAFADFVKKHDIQLLAGTRSIVVVDVHQVGSSCGFSVPFYDFRDFRTTLNDYWSNKLKRFNEGRSKESVEKYWASKNAWSMDGLPGFSMALETAKKEHVAPVAKMVGPLAPHHYRNDRRFGLRHLAMVSILTAILTLAFTISLGLLSSCRSRRVLSL
ncbi:hypothetical protein B0T24DRAFT_660661 [Lasiosphaeria ovina]|uniref:Pyridoxamine 5'-phosphate oxidase N-terminal domain-containing protein n=1 Tax=Lasiosphaeria ovina TaxID=92902 RepID=A0AAE0JSB3_9PEZI|nr:hypothetical protein B0T24DRAFT_660661 [Lasiosphaeria ovina]